MNKEPSLLAKFVFLAMASATGMALVFAAAVIVKRLIETIP